MPSILLGGAPNLFNDVFLGEHREIVAFCLTETKSCNGPLAGIENLERPSAVVPATPATRRSPAGSRQRPNPPSRPSTAKTKQPSPITKRVGFGVNRAGEIRTGDLPVMPVADASLAYAPEGPLGTSRDRFWTLATKKRPRRVSPGGYRHCS